MWCTGLSLQWLLLLQSTGSRHEGSVVSGIFGLLEVDKVRCNSQCFSEFGETGDTADGMY